jgi:hypothetical protein
MGHFAKVVDGKVVQVIVAEPEFFDTFVDTSPGCIVGKALEDYDSIVDGIIEVAVSRI